VRRHFIIRPVVPEDFNAWQTLWNSYNAFYGRAGPTALPSEITGTTWARFLDAHEPVHALVAECSGELLGLAHYLFHRSTIQITPVCYLQDLLTNTVAMVLYDQVADKSDFVVYRKAL